MDGVILADKPAGVSSHDVVAAVRRTLDGVRTGHAGTLDPFATGLLLVLVGRATRIQRLLMALPKTYEVLARLGAVSTTGDPEGQITITGKLPDPAAVLPEGLVRQRPPAYSAVKIDGERAYRRARRGEEVRTREREVHVERFECLWREDDRAAYRITCSAGTYVRALIADLGDAYCERLRRTRIGPFAVQEASLEDLRPAPQQLIDGLIGVPEALEFLPQVRLESEDARRAAHGRPVPAPPALHASAGGAAAVSVLVTDDRGAVAVTELAAAEGGWVLRPVIGFRA